MRNRQQPCATGPSTRWGSNYSTGFIYSKCRGSIYALGVWLCQISRRETCYCCLPGQFRSPRVARPLHNTTVQEYKQSKTMFRRRKNINQNHTSQRTIHTARSVIQCTTISLTLRSRLLWRSKYKRSNSNQRGLTLSHVIDEFEIDTLLLIVLC